MGVNPISGSAGIKTETGSTQASALPPDGYEKLMQEQIEVLAPERKKNVQHEELQAAEDTDSDRHLDAFIHQTLAHAPEFERKIWADLRKAMDI